MGEKFWLHLESRKRGEGKPSISLRVAPAEGGGRAPGSPGWGDWFSPPFCHAVEPRPTSGSLRVLTLHLPASGVLAQLDGMLKPGHCTWHQAGDHWQCPLW